MARRTEVKVKEFKKKKRLNPDDLLVKHWDAKVEVEHDGNFTIAIVKKKRIMAIGVSKKSPADPYVPERGENIALYRALVKLDRALK